MENITPTEVTSAVILPNLYSHPKITDGIQNMLINPVVNLPYYGEFNLFLNFIEKESVGTCGVNVSMKGMNFYFNPEFLNKLSQEEVNFITIHEDFHLIFNHPQRTVRGGFDHKIANIVQDMIINSIIWEDISRKFVAIPQYKEGEYKGCNMGLFIPKEYTGQPIFEYLYNWFKDEQTKWKELPETKEFLYKVENARNEVKNTLVQELNKQSEEENEAFETENADKSEKEKNKAKNKALNKKLNEVWQDNLKGEFCKKEEYGPYGKLPTTGEIVDMFTMDSMLRNLELSKGQYMDCHMEDEVPEDMRDSMVRDACERLATRGLTDRDIEKTLGKLRKPKKDYLKDIKRIIAKDIFGHIKNKTITRPNRRGIDGLKGKKKYKAEITCLLDTSGSMSGLHEKVLSYIYSNDIQVNLIQCDTQVHVAEKIKSKRQLDSYRIEGLGETILQPGVDYAAANYPGIPVLVLGDGYCDSLDFSKIIQPVLIISAGVKIPVISSNGNVKQIVLEKTV